MADMVVCCGHSYEGGSSGLLHLSSLKCHRNYRHQRRGSRSDHQAHGVRGRIHSSSLDDSPLSLLANGFVFRAGQMSLTWRGVPSTSTACSLTMPVICPLQKLVVHQLLGGFTQTVSPNSNGPLVPCQSGRRMSVPLMRTRYRWIALAGTLAAVTASFGIVLYL